MNDEKCQGNTRGHFYYYQFLVTSKKAEKVFMNICETLKAMIKGLNFTPYKARNEDGL